MNLQIAIGPCIVCGHLFVFNPTLVPSLIGEYDKKGHFRQDVNGKREPICEDCFDRGNELRRKDGLNLFDKPAGAWGPEEI